MDGDCTDMYLYDFLVKDILLWEIKKTIQNSFVAICNSRNDACLKKPNINENAENS